MFRKIATDFKWAVHGLSWLVAELRFKLGMWVSSSVPSSSNPVALYLGCWFHYVISLLFHGFSILESLSRVVVQSVRSRHCTFEVCWGGALREWGAWRFYLAQSQMKKLWWMSEWKWMKGKLFCSVVNSWVLSLERQLHQKVSALASSEALFGKQHAGPGHGLI